MKQNSFKDLWEHVPSTIKTMPFTNPAATLILTINALSTQPNPPSKSSIKKPRFFTIFVWVNNHTSSSQEPMPIQINNFLLSICLYLGLIEDEKNKMRMLLDTGAVTNSSNLNYHLWVMSQCPEMVGEFIQCEADTEYDVV